MHDSKYAKYTAMYLVWRFIFLHPRSVFFLVSYHQAARPNTISTECVLDPRFSLREVDYCYASSANALETAIQDPCFDLEHGQQPAFVILEKLASQYVAFTTAIPTDYFNALYQSIDTDRHRT